MILDKYQLCVLIIDNKDKDRTCKLISEDQCYYIKTKLKPDKIICHSTNNHIENVNKQPQFLICVGPQYYMSSI